MCVFFGEFFLAVLNFLDRGPGEMEPGGGHKHSGGVRGLRARVLPIAT